jgi:hypothetical protein
MSSVRSKRQLSRANILNIEEFAVYGVHPKDEEIVAWFWDLHSFGGLTFAGQPPNEWRHPVTSSP